MSIGSIDAVRLQDGMLVVDIPVHAKVYHLDGTPVVVHHITLSRFSCEYRGKRVHNKQEMTMFRFPGSSVTMMFGAQT